MMKQYSMLRVIMEKIFLSAFVFYDTGYTS